MEYCNKWERNMMLLEINKTKRIFVYKYLYLHILTSRNNIFQSL